MVQIRFFAAAASAAGTDQITVQPQPEETLISAICREDQPLYQVAKISSFLVDGKFYGPQTTFQELQNPQVIDVLPPFAGG